MKFPRPDGVSLTGGLVCLGYEDNDERDLAFDWLEAFGNGDVRDVNKIDVIVKAAKALADSISFDENGALLSGKWIGGHGGLISKETHCKADEVIRIVHAIEKEGRDEREGRCDCRGEENS